MTSDGRRARRVAETIRASITGSFLRELDDPRLTSVVVTTVDVPDDLSNARIGVRLLIGDEQEAGRKDAVARLRRAAGRIRRALAPKLGLRRVPELEFHYDTGHDASRRVDELLREIADEPKAQD